METLIPSSVQKEIEELVSIAAKDKKAEMEIKVLAGQIQTKDTADRIVKAIQTIAVGEYTDEHRATFSYSDGLRVNVFGPENILKVCSTNSFRGVPLEVERKRRYFDVPGNTGGKDIIDVPDLRLRFTLRHEDPLRKDFSGSPMDPASHLRILHRKSWVTSDRLLRVDMSMVKTKQKQHKTFPDVLRQTPTYELEVEVINRDTPAKEILQSMFRNVEPLVAAFQQSTFLITESDRQRYMMEMESTKMRFINPVTMERRHLLAERPHNILSGYTVTNKADGERCMLVVARDKRLLRWSRDGRIAWTGLVATKDTHIGDVMDGEYIYQRNLFCIFDAYHFRGKNILRLPLMTTDDDVSKDPLKSRLGCAHQFVEDLKKDFAVSSARTPLRIETKMFLAGNGPAMEQAIRTILDTKFEYMTDGLIFTPRASPVAPITERRGDTWLRVYKWKPADQNSIDFLVSFKMGESYDPVLGQRVVRGSLYVSRTPGSDVVYPCETLTGEYKQPDIPAELRVVSETRDRAPSPFQPSTPKSPDAYQILIPVNAKGVPVDLEGNRIEDNTIIECSRDVEKGRWRIMRTRYDKTYQYRVLSQAQFGNDINVAESIWTNIHNPVTEDMIRTLYSSPPSDSFEDELYYRDSLEARDRVMRDVMDFHNKIKEGLYQSTIKKGDTLLELAVGRANDLHKWRKTKPSKIVGIDLSRGNLEGVRQGACVRYLQENAKEKLPPALFIEGNMTQPLLQQDNRYLKMLDKQEPAPTEYLQKFVGLTEFDVISCQFAIHYACESEETFRTFVGNLTRHGKGMFFGTCMDGQSVYSLLLGKEGHIFRSNDRVFGEFTKDYADGDGWTEEFGKAIHVKLESFERPTKEYLVPFGKVTEILKENGFELIESTLFRDEYAAQTRYVLTGDIQAFSFLHRGFVFKRVAEPPKPKEEEPQQEVEVPVVSQTEEQKPATKEEKKKSQDLADALRKYWDKYGFVEDEPKEIMRERVMDNEEFTPKERALLTGEPITEAEAAEMKPKKKRVLKARIPKEEEKKPEEEIVYFFTGNPALNDNRFLSNMYEAPIQIDGVTFPTVEHYFQWSKAKQFGDAAMQAKILKSESPKSAKAYGKKVKPFDPEVWGGMAVNVMKTAVKAKFMQHPELLDKLRKTGTKLLAEADPRGKFWGIGTSADTSKAKDSSRWPGKNMMGKILME
jgi:ribA/ribD-fused uncharacterized protein